MKKIVLALAVVVGLGLAGMDTPAAQAAGVGVHIGGSGIHVNVGRVHPRGHHVVVPSYYSGYYTSSPYYWQPGVYVRHGHHLHYVPGHWERSRPRHYLHGVYGF